MKRIYFLLASVLLIASLEMAAQTIPVNTRFGKVSKEEVELMEYPADTSASALMLYEYTSVSIDFAPCMLGYTGQKEWFYLRPSDRAQFRRPEAKDCFCRS